VKSFFGGSVVYSDISTSNSISSQNSYSFYTVCDYS
jgi:hypothetical protein